MNTKALEAFRAIMLAGSMTAAARLIHTTQPNISRLIANLEDELGLKLFIRDGNKLQVTDEGIAFFKEVEQHYAGLNALKDAARTIKQFGSGRLRIAAAPVLSQGFLTGVVEEFSRKYPEVTLSIRTCNSNMVEQLVISQLCDLGLVAFIGRAIEPGIESRLLADVKGVCLMRNDHPLASRDVIYANDLEGVGFISISHQNGSRERVDSIFHETGVNRKIQLEAENAATICHLVARGLGVSILTSIIAQDFLPLGLLMKDFYPSTYFPITLLRSSHRPPSLLATAFIEVLVAALNLQYDDAGSYVRE